MTRALHTFPASIRFSNFVRRLNSRGVAVARAGGLAIVPAVQPRPVATPDSEQILSPTVMLCPPENPPGDDAPLPHPTSSIDRAICSSRYAARYRAGDANAVLIARCCEPRLPTPEA